MSKKRKEYEGHKINIDNKWPQKPFKQWIHKNLDEILKVSVPISAEKVATYFKVTPTERGRLASLLKEMERRGYIITLSCIYRPNYNLKGPIPEIKEDENYKYERIPLRDATEIKDNKQKKLDEVI